MTLYTLAVKSELEVHYSKIPNSSPPPLINFGKFLLKQQQNIQSILSIKAILTNFSVPELY